MFLAVVHPNEIFDTCFAFGGFALVVFGWVQLDRREKRKRVARKEKLAQFKLDRLRRQREYDAAQRYLGGTVR